MLKNIIKLVLLCIIIAGCKTTNNNTSNNIGSEKERKKSSENSIVVAGLKFNNLSYYIRGFQIYCENINTGKSYSCITGKLGLTPGEKQKYRVKSVSSFKKIPKGEYTFTHAEYFHGSIIHTAKRNQNNIYFNKETQVSFILDKDFTYLGNISISMGKNNFYVHDISGLSIESDYKTAFLNLPIKKQKVLSKNEITPQILTKKNIPLLPYVSKGEWGSINLDYSCKKFSFYLALAGGNAISQLVDDKGLSIKGPKYGMSLLKAPEMSKRMKCAISKYLGENNLTEFRQTENFTSAKVKWNTVLTFPLEFR